MKVGVVTELKLAERRVALTPQGARTLIEDGHQVMFEPGAGLGSGFGDHEYAAAGATPKDSDEIWGTAELVVKVKEPSTAEYALLHEDLMLFAYLHLAAEPALTQALIESGATAIAYETVEDEEGRLPLLAPMSEIAGRLATQAGAYFLQAPQGGSGVLIGGAPGVASARVLVLGGGVAGTNAARVAVGMGADVTILELAPGRLRELEQLFGPTARVLMSDPEALESTLPGANLLIGAVLIPGARSPRLISRRAVGEMGPGSVIVDVAIDQGGCAETSRPTTYDDPTYEIDGAVHYCVANMPGAVPVTSTYALTNATLPYVLSLANNGLIGALQRDPGLATGINVAGGNVTHEAVATSVGVDYVPPEQALAEAGAIVHRAVQDAHTRPTESVL